MILWRSNKINDTEDEKLVICNNHERKWLDMFSFNEKFCSDPYKLHKKNNNYRLTEIDINTAKKLMNYKTKNIDLTPGKKLCHNCKVKVDEFLRSEEVEDYEELNSSLSDLVLKSQVTGSSGYSVSQTQDTKDEFGKFLKFLEIQNLNPEGYHDYERKKFAKRKLEEINDSVETRLKIRQKTNFLKD